eukprot:scaffold176750_cov51-Prasinocladus_malaysianus.AAC.1
MAYMAPAGHPTELYSYVRINRHRSSQGGNFRPVELWIYPPGEWRADLASSTNRNIIVPIIIRLLGGQL